MENTKTIEIMVGFLLSLLSATMIWVLSNIVKLKTDLQAIKTNYVSQFGEVKLKIEESKNLTLQENQTTRHALKNEIQQMTANIYREFLTKEDFEREKNHVS